jgi:hypothetical protein
MVAECCVISIKSVFWYFDFKKKKNFFLVFEKHSISESEGIKDEGTGSDSVDEIRVRSQTSFHSEKTEEKQCLTN